MWTPKAHHKLGVKWLLQHACAGLLADPGMGKTSITLAAIKVLLAQGLVNKVLVVAPLRPCYLVWPLERQLWKDFHGLRMQVLHGPHKEKALATEADIYVINPDGLPWLLANGGEKLQQLGVDMLVVDESTKFKHTNTKRFKQIKPYLDTFRRRVILTGTPTPNGYLDLFGQVYLIDLGKALGQYITHYRFNYFYPSGYGGYTWLLKDDSEKAIQQAIAPYCLRLEADAKDMPEIIPNVLRIELPDKARKMYDQLEDDLLTRLESGTEVAAKNAAAASIKCRQVANGGLYYYDDEPLQAGVVPVRRERHFENLHYEKVDAVEDLFEQLQGSPLIVAYDFEHDLNRLLQRWPKAAVMGGGTSMKESLQIERLWNAGKLDLLLAHPQAMGHGLNLQKGPGHTVCWHSLTYDYELYDQFIRRVWRSGQRSKHVTVHHVVARNTVDEAALQALRSKARSQQALLQALKNYAKQRINQRDNTAK